MTTEHPDDLAWDEFCARLYAQNQFAIKLGLEPMRQALQLLGHPDRSHAAILIAGTNGKGTTASAMSAILTAAGLKVGLYTSPHLIELTERFRVNGQALSREAVLTVGHRIFDQFGAPDAQPRLTFFELTTLMAICLFDAQQVDVAIYEVGLGGRLDATNALEPALSIITTIGYDHQQYLGETLTQIAAEKAAISRAGAPVIIGPQEHDEAKAALRAALPNAAYFGDPNTFGAKPSLKGAAFILSSPGLGDVGLERASQSTPQTRAAHFSTAIYACEQILLEGCLDAAYPKVALKRGAPASPARWRERCLEALERVRWHGRFDRRTLLCDGAEQGVSFLLDAAHNADGAAALLGWLQREQLTPDTIIFGAMGDKDLTKLTEVLHAYPHASIFGALIQNPRAANAERLHAIIPPDQLVMTGTVEQLIPAICDRSSPTPTLDHPPKTVLVYGSIYLLGEVMRWAGWSAAQVH